MKNMDTAQVPPFLKISPTHLFIVIVFIKPFILMASKNSLICLSLRK